MQFRSRNFPSTRLKLLGGKMRAHRSVAYVLDSEEEEEEVEDEDLEGVEDEEGFARFDEEGDGGNRDDKGDEDDEMGDDDEGDEEDAEGQAEDGMERMNYESEEGDEVMAG